MKIQQWLFELLRKQSVTDGRTDRRTDARTDGQRENSIPPTNKVCGGYNEKKIVLPHIGVAAILVKWPKQSNEYSIKQPSDFWGKDV